MPATTFKKRIRLKGFDYQGCFRYSLTFCTGNKSPHFDNHLILLNVADILQETAKRHDFKIWSFCFMPDHLHVLVEGEKTSSDLRKFASLFKQKSGYWFRRYNNKNVGLGLSPANKASLKACPTENHKDGDVGQGFSPANQAASSTGSGQALKGRAQKKRAECKDLWQINYYVHVLRSEEATEKVARYILDNPVRKGMVEDYRSYPFSWCDIFGFVGQGFSPANNNKNVGQGFSLANKASLKACPTEKRADEYNPKGLPYKSGSRINNSGFTLIESIITIVIVGIISGIAAMIILEGMKASTTEQNLSDAHYQARIAMERMAREIRLIRSQTAGDIQWMAATDLIFCDVTGRAVEFQLSGTALNRRESATCSPLAWGGWNTLSPSGVNPLTFTYLDSAGAGGATAANLWFVEIKLTDTQGSESLQMQTRVHPRNF